MHPMRLLVLIFSCIGLAMLLGAAFLVMRTSRFIARSERAPGMVIENVKSRSSRSSSLFPKVRFRTHTGREVEFVSSYGSYPPSYDVNDSITVLYDPDDPGHAMIRSFMPLWFAPMMLLVLALIFGSIGIIPRVIERRDAARDAWLRQNGWHIPAEFERVELNKSVRVNGSSPYRIVCQWQDSSTDKVHVFKSRNLWFDPSAYIIDKKIDVIVDPKDYSRYLVETSFLPKLAEQAAN